jgi:hypothetical protein
MRPVTTVPSWPGLTRPSAHDWRCADGRVKPGHDGENTIEPPP